MKNTLGWGAHSDFENSLCQNDTYLYLYLTKEYRASDDTGSACLKSRDRKLITIPLNGPKTVLHTVKACIQEGNCYRCIIDNKILPFTVFPPIEGYNILFRRNWDVLQISPQR